MESGAEVQALRRELERQRAEHEEEQRRFEESLEQYEKKRLRWRDTYAQMRAEICGCASPRSAPLRATESLAAARLGCSSA